jgi:hypothetical protein
MTTVEDTNNDKIKFSDLNRKIAELDSLLEGMKQHVADFKDDTKVYDAIVVGQDSLFRVTQIMRGCEIIEFAEPMIEPNDVLFWEEEQEKNKEDHEL